MDNPGNIDQNLVANILQNLEIGIRPPKFDRKSGEVRLFFQKYDKFLRLRPNWNDRNKVEYFANLIDGECLGFYDTIYDPEAININYENIKNEFIAHYETAYPTFIQWSLAVQRKQLHNESITDFYDDLLKLTRELEVPQPILLYMFLNGVLEETKIYISLLPNPPNNIGEALNIAKTFQSVVNSKYDIKTMLAKVKEENKPLTALIQNHEKHDSVNYKNIKIQINELSEKLDKLITNLPGKLSEQYETKSQNNQHYQNRSGSLRGNNYNHDYIDYDIAYDNRELNNNQNCEKYNEINYFPENYNCNITQNLSDEHYSKQDNTFDKINEPEREEETHKNEFINNYIPTVNTVTKNRKDDQIVVEKSKNLEDLNKTKTYPNENIKQNYNPHFPQNYNKRFPKVNKHKSFKGNHNERKKEDIVFSYINIPTTVDNSIENEDISPKTSKTHKKTDTSITNNDKKFSNERIIENTEKIVTVRGILKNELTIPPFTEINTCIIPEEEIEQKEVNLTAIPSLMIEKCVMAYNKRNVLKNEDGSFTITLSNLSNEEIILENEFPITYLEFKEQNTMNKTAVITVNKETNVNEKVEEKCQTETKIKSTNNTIYLDNRPPLLNMKPQHYYYSEKREQTKHLEDKKIYCHTILSDPHKGIKTQIPTENHDKNNTDKKTFAELDILLKTRHKKKTLNEIREYFQTNKTIKIVENITNKFQNKQENISSAMLSTLNQICTELTENKNRINTLQKEIGKLNHETNNLKQNLINNDKKNINICESLHSNQIEGKTLTEQSYYQKRQLDSSNTTNGIKTQNNNIASNTLIDEITTTNNHEIKPVINQTDKLINDTKRHQIIIKAQIHNRKIPNFNLCPNNIQNILPSETTNGITKDNFEESSFDDTNLNLNTDNSTHHTENTDFVVKQNDNIEISEETIIFNKNIPDELLEVINNEENTQQNNASRDKEIERNEKNNIITINIEENNIQNDDLRNNDIRGIEVAKIKAIPEELLKIENFEECFENKPDDSHNYLLNTNNCVLI